MNGFDIIIIAFIAAFILLKLRSELGSKSGTEDLPPRAQHGGGYGTEERVPAQPVPQPAPQPENDRVITDFTADPALRAAYSDIRSADPDFDPRQFLEGARSAYPMILEAFWSGDLSTLDSFLDRDVFEDFKAAVDARKDAEQVADNRIKRLVSADVVSARLHGASAEVTVAFESETVLVTRDAAGQIIHGSEDEDVTVKDIWTFARNTRSDSPNWTLVGTRTG